jgi:hypothetical protein
MTARPILRGLALGAAMLAAAAIFKIGEHRGLLGAETAARAMQVVIGLMLAFYGNFIPKNLPVLREPARTSARMQSALRFGGWAFTLAGLAYAAIWAWAPLTMAGDISVVIVAAATVAALAYGVWACRTATGIGDDPVTD